MSADFGEGYDKAVALLHRCNSEHGFLASPIELANYRRIWSLDGSIMGLAALPGPDGQRAGRKRPAPVWSRRPTRRHPAC